jgi:hypothetical protein
VSALDNLRRVLEQHHAEPDEALLIRGSVDPSQEWFGFTWGDLRAVIDEARDEGARDEYPAYRRALGLLIRQKATDLSGKLRQEGALTAAGWLDGQCSCGDAHEDAEAMTS